MAGGGAVLEGTFIGLPGDWLVVATRPSPDIQLAALLPEVLAFLVMLALLVGLAGHAGRSSAQASGWGVFVLGLPLSLLGCQLLWLFPLGVGVLALGPFQHLMSSRWIWDQCEIADCSGFGGLGLMIGFFLVWLSLARARDRARKKSMEPAPPAGPPG